MTSSIIPALMAMATYKTIQEENERKSSSSPSESEPKKTKKEDEKVFVPVIDDEAKKLLREMMEVRDRVDIAQKEYNHLKNYADFAEKFLNNLAHCGHSVSSGDKNHVLDKMCKGEYTIHADKDIASNRIHILIDVDARD